MSVGLSTSAYLACLFRRRLGRWPPLSRTASAAMAVTSLGTELLFSSAASSSPQFCHSCPDNSGWVVFGLNLLLCGPMLAYRLRRLSLALDSDTTLSSAALYAPIALLAVFDGELLIWLPWIETDATRALNGFPDLTSVAFTNWSLMCRKVPFLALAIKFAGNDPHLATLVTFVTGLSLVLAFALKLLRSVGYPRF